jgi:hypothetical protein
MMDPRSPATSEVLAQQLELAQQIYAETLEGRRVLAEISSVQKKLADAQQKLGEQTSALKLALTDAQAEISRILTGQEPAPGLQDAYMGVASALRTVESGDRSAPAQAVALYKQSSEQVKARIAEWTSYKQTKLPTLNQKLRDANLSPIAISEIEQEVEDLISR